MLAVSDTGVGMDAATQARIFEPFFTTKEKGRGTGLGLATVYGIVKQSGGWIWVYSEPGHGTTFKVYFPRVAEVAPPPAATPAPPASVRGTETVLVVEDDEMLLTLVEKVLKANGYTVLVAAHGGDAERVAAQHDGPIHLLMTDVVLPGLNGREVARRLEAVRRGIRVLYLSGYTDDAIVHHGVLEQGVAFLQKPFSPAVLGRKVREVLDSPAT
jgi:CheY-like chemotaxis protein